MTPYPLRSASLKIDRACEHIDHVCALLRNNPPFRWVLETDAEAGYRSIYVERDEDLTNRIAIIFGDAVHAMRSAIDHAYFAVVSPFVDGDTALRRVQFPFSAARARLEKAAKKGYANEVGEEFVAAVLALEPHGEEGGNEPLYLVHILDIPDKHRSLVPTVNQIVISGEKLRNIAPDCPLAFQGKILLSGNGRDLIWEMPPNAFISNPETRNRLLKEEIDIPIDVVFAHPTTGDRRSIVVSLYNMADATKQAVDIIGRFARCAPSAINSI